MSEGGGLVVGAGGPTQGALLPLQVESLVLLRLSDSPHSPHGVTLRLPAVGHGQTRLSAGEYQHLALQLRQPGGLLHHHSREVVQRVEHTEEDRLVGVEVLELLSDLPLHQQPELAGPAGPDWEL